jgi:hypothetical protein
LVLPPVFDSDKYGAFSIHLETVRLNEVCTIDLIKVLLDTVYKLGEDVALRKSDSAALKSQINKLYEKAGQPQGTLPYIVGLQAEKEIVTYLQRPHFGMRTRTVPQLQFLDLRILLHLQKIADRGIFLD